ncbi:MAG: pyruvate:ferredoxin (flavodoxin) oxidoreductase [Gammaproteobacteria bacterium]|nr:pyruvate:ferredoxin (flavodoxin) oxidoreductase [Gammaproteobacteria bacterium]
MAKQQIRIIDANEAAADVAYRTNEICIIYPITPASGMGELSDAWKAEDRKNIWGDTPDVVEMQSEGGAAGAIHGAAQTGALTTSFTASQGILLMIPNMYRIAAELSPTVFHVASRALAPQGMTIYSEHSDVMAVRSTGFALLSSNNVQEAHDFAAIAQATTLKASIPIVHFFDGFRTSHEVSKINYVDDEILKQLIDDEAIFAFRARRMHPENPIVRGLVYNNDIFFQQRESVSKYYDAMPQIMQDCMDQFGKLTGRYYKIYEYYGDPNAEKVIILMGSAADTAEETIAHLNKTKEKVGVLKVRLFQPFSTEHFFKALPATCQKIAVLDRIKDPGAGGEPLYQKIATAVLQRATSTNSKLPLIIGGRYGIGGKEFTPSMIKAIFDELDKETPKNQFTIGIDDDIQHSSIAYEDVINIENDKVKQAIFYGLGADGTVSANKNTVKIIGSETENFVQAYFVYDAKKSGSKTVSHLRFSPEPIKSAYLITNANFIGVHQFNFVYEMDVLKDAANGSVLLLNSPYSPDETWSKLPCSLQSAIIDKTVKCYCIDAYKVARDSNLGHRINTIMQTCFFALANIISKDDAIEKIKTTIEKTYSKKGADIVKQNFAAVDNALANLHEVPIGSKTTTDCASIKAVNGDQPQLVKDVIIPMMAGHGDKLKVSQLPPDGSYPTNTTKLEKRNIALEVPVWDMEKCIQCGKCSLVCPHAVIRAKKYDADLLKDAPENFKAVDAKGKDAAGQKYTIQVSLEDCTGCKLCVENCPVKDKALHMENRESILDKERESVEFFNRLPSANKNDITSYTVNNIQFIEPQFEFCGACAGCGEAPYVKLISQLYGDRLLIANACGCSSVYGGNMPTSPWTLNKDGMGPTWSSSLFEDNAEFGFGMQLTEDQHRQEAEKLLRELSQQIGDNLVSALISAPQTNDLEISEQRARVTELKQKLATINSPKAKHLLTLANNLVKHSVWSFGGDGWAYDIGFGGLDHVMASGRDINILVMDTEVYSNTGGQASKASPRGAVVKFAANGKPKAKKDLGLMMMSYGDVYVASIALGSNPMQAIKAIKEAEAYNGPSLILAYSHCIAHGINMQQGMQQQDKAVKSGYWLLYRHNPELIKEGKNPLQLDSKEPTVAFEDYIKNENRYQVLARSNPERAKKLIALAEEDVARRWNLYKKLAS